MPGILGRGAFRAFAYVLHKDPIVGPCEVYPRLRVPRMKLFLAILFLFLEFRFQIRFGIKTLRCGVEQRGKATRYWREIRRM